MPDIRFRYTRGDRVKYISHLDLMKTFERALRRAGIPVAYTQGFNPHQKIVFGLPLSVGTTSEAEYADIELREPMEPAEFAALLNGQLPEGLKVLKAKGKNEKANIMASIVLASYKIYTDIDGIRYPDGVTPKIREFMDHDSLVTEKRSRRGTIMIDIRPMICEFDIIPAKCQCAENGGEEGMFTFSAVLRAGSRANLNPELLLRAFAKTTDLIIKVGGIHRTGLFVESGNEFADPFDGV